MEEKVGMWINILMALLELYYMKIIKITGLNLKGHYKCGKVKFLMEFLKVSTKL